MSPGENGGTPPLSAVCEVNPPKPNLKDLPDETPVLFVPMAAVDARTGTVTAAEERPLGEVRRKSYKTFAPGDVLFAKITPCMENGKCAIVPPIASGIGFGSTEFHVLRPKQGLDGRYLWHYLRRRQFRQAARARMTGSVGQERVPAGYLESLPFSLSSPEEQEETVDLLDLVSDRGRSAADHLERSRRAMELLRAAVFTAATSGELTAGWREEHSEEKIAPGPPLSEAALRHARNAPNTNELIEIPASWGWWSIESAMEEVIDYRGRTPPNAPSGPIPHLRTTQIRNGRIDWEGVDRFVTKKVYAEYMTRGIPQPGDVLLTMEAPTGEVAIVDRETAFSLAQRILLLRPKPFLSGQFLALSLQSSAVRLAIEYRTTGSGVSGLAYKRFRSLLIPVPPLAEQDEIVRGAMRLIDIRQKLTQRIESATASLGSSAQAVNRAAFA